MTRYLHLAFAAAAACSGGKAPAPAPGSGSGSAPAASGSATDQTRVAAEVRTSIAEFLTYSERVFAIVHDHDKDCDGAAKALEALVPDFQELGPRMMKLKEAMASLDPAEQDALRRESDAAMAAYKARHPDVDSLDATARACEKTSPAFAAIAPKVMFVKKH